MSYFAPSDREPIPELLGHALRPIVHHAGCIQPGEEFKFAPIWCLGGAWLVMLAPCELAVEIGDERLQIPDFRIVRELLPEEQHW